MNALKKIFLVMNSLVIAIVVWITYLPALKIQFYDGWWYLVWSATMDLPRYLTQFLDPANITQGYRPVQGLYMYLLYHLFGFNPDGYHWAHNLLHAANAILLFLIVGTLSARWRMAFVAALIYAVLPNYSLAVFWHAVVDPLAGFFYLLTILLWTRFLDTRRARDYAVAFCAFVLALFSKEIAIFLPLFLFLIEWWFYRVPPNLRALAPRYAPFLLACIPYLWLVYQVQSRGEFVGQFGFRIGPHMLNNLIPYAAVLAFPWFTELPTDSLAYVWLALVAAAYVGVMIYTRSAILLLLALFAVLNIAPLLGFPLDYFHPRYLYLSTISSAIVLAVLFERLWSIIGARRVAGAAVAFLVGLVALVSSAQVAESAAGLAEYTRQIRVPFRDIARARPTFPPNSYVYFVYSPFTSFWDFEGLFFARYGQNVKVNATDLGSPANWRQYDHAYVYYFDSTGKPIEIGVDKDGITAVNPALPARLQIPIVLEQYQTPTTRLERGKALVVILNWRATEKIERDYSVFAHLVDGKGNLIAEYNGPPINGKAPTSRWDPHRTIVDAAVLRLAGDAPIGDDYRLEIGMYDLETLERLSFVDVDGTPIADKIVIGSFRIER
ncbi:MAG: glycosyltransferase family 39 protein [Chloroflexi bacterium]|nr:glycosyltransferase family 39 protein [Chloroflexota bacterium]